MENLYFQIGFLLFDILFLSCVCGWNGHPYILNCVSSVKMAKKFEFPNSIRVDLFPKWSNWTEEQYFKNLVYDNYTWTFTMVQVGGKTLHYISIKDWLLKNGAMLSIPPYGVRPGFYRIYVKAKPLSPGLPPNKSPECVLIFKARPPVAVISGGKKQTVPPHAEITLTGEESFDVNTERNDYKDLVFSWSCTQKLPAKLCAKSPLSKSSTLVISGNYLESGDVVQVRMEVTTRRDGRGSYTKSSTFIQTIEVQKDAIHLQIVCQKNCPPVSDGSNNQFLTFLSVKCLSGCSGIKNEDYEWTVESLDKGSSFKIDYNKQTQFGRNSNNFAIEKNVFDVGTYKVTVHLKDSVLKKGEAELILKFLPAPKIKKCELYPQRGDSVATPFQLLCVQENTAEANHYELYAVPKSASKDQSKYQLVLDGYYPQVLSERFTLPPSDQYNYFVNIKKDGGLPVRFDLKPRVISTFKNKKGAALISSIKDVYRSKDLPWKLRSQNTPDRVEAIQQFHSLVDAIVENKFKTKEVDKFVQDFKFEVIKDMLKVQVESVNEVVKISDAISKLVNHMDLKKSDPLLGKFTTTICSRMIDRHLELVMKDKFPLNHVDKSNQMSNALARCLEANTNPNDDVVKPIEHSITTEAPTFEEEVLITENYANYEDFDEKYYQNLNYLKESTYNVINATAKSAKVLALTSAIGENFVKSSGARSATVVAKNYGNELSKIRLKSHGVTLIPSQDLANDEHPYDILMSTWNKDLMWWNPAKIQIYTDIVNVEFWHSTCKERVRNFTNPAQLFFGIKKDKSFKVKYVKDNFVVPEGYRSLSGEDLERLIKVRRISVPKGQGLYVEFSKVSSALDVVITIYKFPCEDDFVNATKVGTNGTSNFNCINEGDYDIWCYVGVLANKNIATHLVTYTTSYISAYCLRWFSSNNSWISACKLGNNGNTSVINCECNSFSVYAGHLENLLSEVQEVDEPDLELQLVSCHIVFITLATTFALYCVLAICMVTHKRREVYFLSDNERKHRFAYFIVVKTGGGRNAGTTSNVIIRLVGTKTSSKPHVLNYPDPKLKLLQKWHKDMFLMTTEQSLGDIVGIDLWFDCIGPNPDWYCRDILVYDMQQLKEWYFRVKKRLAVIKGETYIALTPMKEEESKRKFRIKCQFNDKYHTWYLWQREANFGYMKKLTVVLSMLLTTYAVVLMFHGVPTIQLKDGLDSDSYHIDALTVFIGITSSFPTFMLHIAIAWCFRLSQSLRPFRLTKICWGVLIFLISASFVFLLVFGFWIPFNNSLIWLTSCIIGITFGIFIYETVFLYFANFFWRLKLIDDVGKKIANIWSSTEAQRWYLYKQFGDLLLRPYFQHLYKPIRKAEAEEKKIMMERRRNVVSELEDLVMFGVYIVILYIVALANKDHLLNQSKMMLEDVMAGVHTRSMSFADTESSQNIYDYINQTLIPSLQPIKWYGNYVVSDPGLMIDMSNKYIGVARLRQVRVKNKTCRPPDLLHFLNLTCRPEITFYLVESRTFGYGWGKFSEFLEFDRLRNIWKYAREHETGTFATAGEFATYTGGGYLANLGRTLYNSYANVRKFFQKFWIDRRTRSIFIEFLTYNANYNVFNSVRLLFEQSASGYTYKSINVDAVRMLFVQNEVEKITVIFFFMFVAWVGMLFFKQSLGVIKKFKSFYKDVWFIVDFIIISMSISTIGLFILRMKMIGVYLQKLETIKHNEFLNYFYLFYLEDFLKILAAVLVCIATIRLWKFLRFGLMFRVLERTLAVSIPSLMSFTMVYLVLLLTFAQPLVFLCGNHLEKIDTIVKMLRLMFTMAMNAGEMEMQNYLHFRSSVFLIVSYGFMAKITFLIFIIIIMTAYSDAQMEFSVDVSNYTVKHYVQEKVKYFPKFVKYKYRRRRLKGGEEDKTKIEAKSDKFVYSNCFSIETDRMTAMFYITKCIFRNIRTVKVSDMTDWDIELMSGVSRQYLVKNRHENVEIFFKGRIKGKKIALIDEKRVLKVAEAVNLILQEKDEKRMKTKTSQSKAMFEYEKCVKIIRKNQNSLKECDLSLGLLLEKVTIVELELAKLI